ncbi:MAG: hypothetical protein JWQ44_192 [Chthoniobacter sp.]|nr:hypothetical protein [Chthoniobacter sp.]
MNFETGTPKAFECFSPGLERASYLGNRGEKRSTLQGLHLWTEIVRFNPCGVGAFRGENPW